MNLLHRFGFGRNAGQAEKDRLPGSDAAIFLTAAAASSQNTYPSPASPRVRTIHRATTTTPAASPSDTPYPSRFETDEPESAWTKLGLSGSERAAARALFGEASTPVPPKKAKIKPAPAIKPRRRKMDRGDLTIGALGVVLALTCALFPWYIFFNQDKFGVREFVFEGRGSVTPPAHLAYQPPLVGQPFQTGEVPAMNLDFFPTATVSAEDEPLRAVPPSEQPFPADLVEFRLVHVANGRAMIQDEDGLWVVQPGSRLPDASQVASIEQRDGGWVLVTTLDRVLTLTP